MAPELAHRGSGSTPTSLVEAGATRTRGDISAYAISTGRSGELDRHRSIWHFVSRAVLGQDRASIKTAEHFVQETRLGEGIAQRRVE